MKIKNKIAVIISSVVIITGMPLVSANATETSTQLNIQVASDAAELALEKANHALDVAVLKESISKEKLSHLIDATNLLNRLTQATVKYFKLVNLYNAKANKYKFATTK